MGLVVQKFGGTSVADPERIKKAASRVLESIKQGNQVVVVVSAMSGVTDRLLALGAEVGGENPDPRELDALLATGEQQTVALISMYLRSQGQAARSLTGPQLGMLTDGQHNRARILEIETKALNEILSRGEVAVVAGFQGVDSEGNITTLGRGGSDTSAVAVGAALKADVCEIFTDVEGVYTADPNLVPSARKLNRVSYEEMLEMASLGTKVLQIRSVKFAMQYGLPIHVRSTFVSEEGTWVVREEEVLERLMVSGVTYNRNEAKIRVRGVADAPGAAARIFTPLSEAGIVVDMIVQNVSDEGTTDVTFTVGRSDYKKALSLIESNSSNIGTHGVEGDSGIAKLSVVGVGMRDHAGVAAKMFQVLADEGINIQLITTSEIKISVAVEEKYTELGVRALHAAFVESGAQEPKEDG